MEKVLIDLNLAYVSKECFEELKEYISKNKLERTTGVQFWKDGDSEYFGDLHLYSSTIRVDAKRGLLNIVKKGE